MRKRQKQKNARLREKQKEDGYFELPKDFKRYNKKQSLNINKTLNNVNKLKQKIINYFNDNDFNKAEKNIKFLCENQTDDKYLVKSLSDISTKINNNAKLFVLKLAYEINNHDTVTLTSYATALSSNQEYEKAFELFKKSLEIDGSNTVTLLSFGICLKNHNKYKEAISIFLKILENANLKLYYKEFVHLTLGLLYLYDGRNTLSRNHFDILLELSDNTNTALMKTAITIFKNNPYDEQGINKLLQISSKEGSRLSKKVFGLLSISLTQKKFFKYCNPNFSHDNAINTTLELNSAIYHKVDNQINLLRALLELAISKEKDENDLILFKDIKTIVLSIFKIIKDNKNKEREFKLEVDNYDSIIKNISEIAHNITDKVNNKIFIIQSKLRLISLSKIKEVNNQINTTVATLNNFKDLKQGSISMRVEKFELSQLLTNLKHNMKLENAIIQLNISNGHISSDKQKITECINELIENSIRHNNDKQEIKISINLSIVVNPIIINEKIEGDYLKIVYKDDGKGIEKGKKEWVFNPLNTTIKNGSGLGLFIIKRITERLKARIYEDGIDGVRFMIFIPNLEKG
jgi:signal transduction histidine kinase